ncbi:MAG: MoaD/ThiS family protein [Eubacteriales bacterium]|nr:MoaD/ThiS family protein [Bacillota bacterium]MBV1726682.1 MoaD/ThiS family protein [Desulforudis sp.]MDP3051477.1 MoaD/ThiS family protein [Eubacteriales bacterium]MDQ7789706.1 MoaD/ThiS family protein [Clostridia bacterium]MBU4533005.1 MoaD/ThiS family protein [Bacillota bacterium]
MSDVEVRAFSFIKALFDARGWPTPLIYKLENSCTAGELAKSLSIPDDLVEAVFINGKVFRPGEGVVKPGDRVAFIPPGTPGPYRLLLGIARPAGSGGDQ